MQGFRENVGLVAGVMKYMRALRRDLRGVVSCLSVISVLLGKHSIKQIRGITQHHHCSLQAVRDSKAVTKFATRLAFSASLQGRGPPRQHASSVRCVYGNLNAMGSGHSLEILLR